MKDVLHDATGLCETDRATLAGILIDSLDREYDAGAEAAWKAEIARRLGELDVGSVETTPWEAVRKRLLDRLNAG